MTDKEKIALKAKGKIVTTLRNSNHPAFCIFAVDGIETGFAVWDTPPENQAILMTMIRNAFIDNPDLLTVFREILQSIPKNN